MSQAPVVNLLENPSFKALIDGFSGVMQTASQSGLDAARKHCTEFFLHADPFRAEVKSIAHVEIEGKDQQRIPLDIYTPHSEQALPVIVYLHRGGWIFGNNIESEPVCRLLARYLGCIVVAVDYRLAPEHGFPKPLDDAYAATEWVAQNCSSFGGDAERVIVCGESAGGNLAAAVALMARDKQGPRIASQLLIYPIISSTIHDEVYDQCPDQSFMTKGAMQFMWGAYLQSPEHAENPYASVDRAQSFSDLPPAVIVTAEYDPLRLEAERYAEALKLAGIDVQTLAVPEVIHGFLDLPMYKTERKIAWIEQIRALIE